MDIVGSVQSPLSSTGYGSIQSGAVGLFISNILRLFFVVAGIFALFNFVIAGFKYINAGGDSKKLAEAWASIWQSLLGLTIIVGSFAIASLFGYLIFGDATFILNPKVYGPQ
jgi:hypothetical protein